MRSRRLFEFLNSLLGALFHDPAAQTPHVAISLRRGTGITSHSSYTSRIGAAAASGTRFSLQSGSRITGSRHHGRESEGSRGDHRVGLRRRVHPHLSEPSAGRDVCHLPAQQGQARTGGRCLRRRRPLLEAGRRAGRPEGRRHSHQHADSRPRPAEPGRAESRQARGLHGADGHHHRRVRATGRGPAGQRQALHDDGNGRLQPRVFVRQAALRAGRVGPAAVPARLALAGDGRLARLLGRPAADALRHALREPLPVPARQTGQERGVPRIGPDQRRADVEIRLAVRRRDGHVRHGRFGPVPPK